MLEHNTCGGGGNGCNVCVCVCIAVARVGGSLALSSACGFLRLRPVGNTTCRRRPWTQLMQLRAHAHRRPHHSAAASASACVVVHSVAVQKMIYIRCAQRIHVCTSKQALIVEPRQSGSVCLLCTHAKRKFHQDRPTGPWDRQVVRASVCALHTKCEFKCNYEYACGENGERRRKADALVLLWSTCFDCAGESGEANP